jgi:hypothetical protein
MVARAARLSLIVMMMMMMLKAMTMQSRWKGRVKLEEEGRTHLRVTWQVYLHVI